MKLSYADLLLIAAALSAIMMLGSNNLRTNLTLYRGHALLIAACTAYIGYLRHEDTLYAIAASVAIVKAWFVPWFLNSIVRRLGIQPNPGVFIPTAVSMHVGIALLGASYFLAQKLPTIGHEQSGTFGATAALSLIATGMLLMLTRKTAVNQVVGFLIIENGIYLFSLTQTHDMPLSIEMGVLLDLLVAVMIAGLLLFRIKKSFEHIDVSKLTELKD